VGSLRCATAKRRSRKRSVDCNRVRTKPRVSRRSSRLAVSGRDIPNPAPSRPTVGDRSAGTSDTSFPPCSRCTGNDCRPRTNNRAPRRRNWYPKLAGAMGKPTAAPARCKWRRAVSASRFHRTRRLPSCGTTVAGPRPTSSERSHSDSSTAECTRCRCWVAWSDSYRRPRYRGTALVRGSTVRRCNRGTPSFHSGNQSSTAPWFHRNWYPRPQSSGNSRCCQSRRCTRRET